MDKTHARLHTHKIARIATLMTLSEMHLLVSPTQELYLNPGHYSKGHPVPLGWCACQGSNKPRARWRTNDLFWAVFCGCGLSNFKPPDYGTAIANCRLR